MSVFLQPIYTQTVGAGGASTITFNNIPQGFTDLKIEISARTDNAGDNNKNNYSLRFNGNTDTTYSNTHLYGLGTGTGTARDVGTNSLFNGVVVSSAATANTFSNSEAYIANYTSSNFKSVIGSSVTETNSSNAVQIFNAGLWRNTSPVTSVTISIIGAGNFVQYSTFTLYGIANVYDTAKPLAPTIGTVTDLAGFASVAFTANDSGTGQTADNYSVQDVAIMASPVYSNNSPVIVPVTTGVTYNNLAVSANNALGSNVSANPAGFTSNNNYASIATATSVTSNVVFTNIPQYYRHLQLRIMSRNNTGVSSIQVVRAVFNNDTSASYSYHLLAGNGSSVTVEGGANNSNGIMINYNIGGAQLANAFSVAVTDILDYTNTAQYKTLKSLTGADINGSGNVGFVTGSYYSFAPVTSISINFDSGITNSATTIALYGIG